MIELKGYVIVIDVPVDEDDSVYLSPVSGDESPLSLLIKRMEKLVDKNQIALLTGRDPKHSVYNKFTAMQGVSLHPTVEKNGIKRLMFAVAVHRVKAFVRVSANHTFADPELIEILLRNHDKKKPLPGQTLFGNVPQWAAGEVYDIDLLQKGYTLCQEEGSIPSTAEEFYQLHSDDIFTINRTGAPVRGRWPEAYSLAEPGGYQRIVNAMQRSGDSVNLSVKDLMGR